MHVQLPTPHDNDDLDEFLTLARSAGAELVGVITAKRDAPEAKYFVGTGKLEEIKQAIEAESAELVLFNQSLTPGQERNLERALSCRVLDRIGLILDIFAQRARTYEGKLQVELAQLRHVSTRLIRGWTHLERQKGGIGLRGPGETQLESDRRLIRNRIKAIKQRLERIRNQREQSGAQRRESSVPVVALVGYTNAGKSTLFNRLTEANVYVQDRLFATLDPTLRQICIPGLGHVLFADTVGFIHHLPHELIEAFRATLEETARADVLLHVIDSADDHRLEKIEAVRTVLAEIDADCVPQIEVYNKVDKLPGVKPHIEDLSAHEHLKVWVSAATGSGLDDLAKTLALFWRKKIVQETLYLPPGFGTFRSALYDSGAVCDEQSSEDGGYILQISLLRDELESISRHLEVKWQRFLHS